MAEHPSILPDENRENASHGLLSRAPPPVPIVRGWSQRSTPRRCPTRPPSPRRMDGGTRPPRRHRPSSGSIFEFLQGATVTDRFANGQRRPSGFLAARVFEVGVVTGKVGGGQAWAGTGGAVRVSFSTNEVMTVGYLAVKLERKLPSSCSTRRRTTTAGTRTCRCRSPRADAQPRGRLRPALHAAQPARLRARCALHLHARPDGAAHRRDRRLRRRDRRRVVLRLRARRVRPLERRPCGGGWIGSGTSSARRRSRAPTSTRMRATPRRSPRARACGWASSAAGRGSGSSWRSS